MKKIKVSPKNTLKLRMQVLDYDAVNDKVIPVTSGTVQVFFSATDDSEDAAAVDAALSTTATYVAGSIGIWTAAFSGSILTKALLNQYFATITPYLVVKQNNSFVEATEIEIDWSNDSIVD